MPVAVYFLGRRVVDEREARLSAAIAVLYPVFIYFSNELLIVSLIVLLDVLLLILVLRADESPTRGRWFAAGLLGVGPAIAICAWYNYVRFARHSGLSTRFIRGM